MHQYYEKEIHRLVAKRDNLRKRDHMQQDGSMDCSLMDQDKNIYWFQESPSPHYQTWKPDWLKAMMVI